MGKDILMGKGKNADTRVCALWAQSGGPDLKEEDVCGWQGRIWPGNGLGDSKQEHSVYENARVRQYFTC